MDKQFTYDYCNKQRKAYIDWLMKILPEDTGELIKQKVRFEIIKTLQESRELALNQFCEEHNYCPVCGDGGWECDSDHK